MFGFDVASNLQHSLLSCLFGSEQIQVQDLAIPDFLSCLFGSETDSRSHGGAWSFLSCLFGSELKLQSVAFF